MKAEELLKMRPTERRDLQFRVARLATTSTLLITNEAGGAKWWLALTSLLNDLQ